MTWRDDAACKDMDTNLFFSAGPNGRDGAAYPPTTRAACARCPVATECLDDAFATHDRWGLRAGLAPKQRQKLRAVEVATGVARYRSLRCAGCHRVFRWRVSPGQVPTCCGPVCAVHHRRDMQSRSSRSYRQAAMR